VTAGVTSPDSPGSGEAALDGLRAEAGADRRASAQPGLDGRASTEMPTKEESDER
jgi:hypothetical protein